MSSTGGGVKEVALPEPTGLEKTEEPVTKSTWWLGEVEKLLNEAWNRPVQIICKDGEITVPGESFMREFEKFCPNIKEIEAKLQDYVRFEFNNPTEKELKPIPVITYDPELVSDNSEDSNGKGENLFDRSIFMKSITVKGMKWIISTGQLFAGIEKFNTRCSIFDYDHNKSLADQGIPATLVEFMDAMSYAEIERIIGDDGEENSRLNDSCQEGYLNHFKADLQSFTGKMRYLIASKLIVDSKKGLEHFVKVGGAGVDEAYFDEFVREIAKKKKMCELSSKITAEDVKEDSSSDEDSESSSSEESEEEDEEEDNEETAANGGGGGSS
jgi:hypothetical protein